MTNDPDAMATGRQSWRGDLAAVRPWVPFYVEEFSSGTGFEYSDSLEIVMNGASAIAEEVRQ